MRTILLLITGFAALCSGSASAANLLTNPGFEQSGAPWPTGWSGWGHMSRTSAPSLGFSAHGGDYVLMGSGVYNDAYHAGGLHQTVPAAPGETFRTQAWVYHHSGYALTGGSQAWLKLEFKNAAGTQLASYSTKVMDPGSTKNVWRLVAGPQAVAPAGTTSAVIVLVFMQPNATDAGAGFFDDAVLERVVSGPVSYDLADAGSTFAGFGAQVWGYYYNPVQQYNAMRDLNIRYIRMERESASWSQMQATRVSTSALGIQWIQMIWRAPTQFMDGSNRLLDAQIPAFANWWAAQVHDLYAHNIPVEYIELMNEPDSNGQWSTGITATQYNTLVQLVRTALDAYNGSGGTYDLRGVGIVGPGTSNLANATNYLNALDAGGVAAHDVWSAHAWGTYDSCGPACIQYAWPSFGGAAAARNPDLLQFVTEYATHERTYFGVTYPSADAYGGWNGNNIFPYYSVSNTMPYAVRVYGNTLGLLNNGANAPFLWQLIDFPSAVQQVGKAWGVIDLWGNPKPVYGALATLYPEIPVGAAVLNADGENPDVYTGAYRLGNRLVIGLANGTAAAQSATVHLSGLVCADVLRATAFVQTYAGNPAFGEPDAGQAQARSVAFDANFNLTVSVPAVSTLTVVCTVVPGNGDLDGSGAVDAGDIAAMAGCSLGPAAGMSGCACMDLDGDTDVDTADFAWLQQAVTP